MPWSETPRALARHLLADDVKVLELSLGVPREFHGVFMLRQVMHGKAATIPRLKRNKTNEHATLLQIPQSPGSGSTMGFGRLGKHELFQATQI